MTTTPGGSPPLAAAARKLPSAPADLALPEGAQQILFRQKQQLAAAAAAAQGGAGGGGGGAAAALEGMRSPPPHPQRLLRSASMQSLGTTLAELARGQSANETEAASVASDPTAAVRASPLGGQDNYVPRAHLDALVAAHAEEKRAVFVKWFAVKEAWEQEVAEERAKVADLERFVEDERRNVDEELRQSVATALRLEQENAALRTRAAEQQRRLEESEALVKRFDLDRLESWLGMDEKEEELDDARDPFAFLRRGADSAQPLLGHDVHVQLDSRSRQELMDICAQLLRRFRGLVRLYHGEKERLGRDLAERGAALARAEAETVALKEDLLQLSHGVEADGVLRKLREDVEQMRSAHKKLATVLMRKAVVASAGLAEPVAHSPSPDQSRSGRGDAQASPVASRLPASRAAAAPATEPFRAEIRRLEREKEALRREYLALQRDFIRRRTQWEAAERERGPVTAAAVGDDSDAAKWQALADRLRERWEEEKHAMQTRWRQERRELTQQWTLRLATVQKTTQLLARKLQAERRQRR